jgi:hypothetical protein
MSEYEIVTNTAPYAEDIFPTRKIVTIEHGDYPFGAVAGLLPICFEYPSGYRVARYDVEPRRRTFWQWLTGEPRVWHVTWTLEAMR